ncbi:MAG: hypothetical protein HQL36_03070, partial [Alphaproteobacteria bacterium]|nr:hypothetical protein [Alphaproteobacteria bacterium]
MKLSIRDFLCIERADLDIGSITLVAALNGAGKSTICRGVAQVLTGTPTFGIKKSEAGVLVRDGAPECRISLSDGDSMVAITLPQADYVTTGEPLNATVYAAGLTNIMGLDAKKRAAALADYLGTEPTREHLEAAMKDAGFKAGVVEAAWKAIQEDGWDGVLARTQEFGQKEKGKWEEATGEKGYGSKKGESWTPESWDDDLAQTSVETLQSNLTEAQNDLDGALRNQGAEQSVIDNYKNIVS